MRLLLVDDEVQLATSIARGLRAASFAVDIVHSGEDAIAALAESLPDAVILDRGLPGISGDDVCRALNARPDRPPILMLTAAALVRDRVEGLGLGADDYLVKPFALAELVARIRALGRRPGLGAPRRIEKSGLVVDLAAARVERNGQAILLSPKEYAVLEELLLANGEVLSAEALLERAWDVNADPFTQAVKVTISTLRRKLGQPRVIDTIRGRGYRL